MSRTGSLATLTAAIAEIGTGSADSSSTSARSGSVARALRSTAAASPGPIPKRVAEAPAS
ncbi:MAG: hypothetical protein R2717_02630 [Schumannella sp.]